MNTSYQKWIVTGALITMLGVAGTAVLQSASAAEGNSASDFMSRVANRLGISSEVLQGAVNQTRTEIRGEEVAQAIMDGDLTAEQAALWERIVEYRQAQHDSMSEAEREARQEEHQNRMEFRRATTRAEHKEAMQELGNAELSAMSAALGVDVDTTQSTMEAVHEARLGGQMGANIGFGEGHRGKGNGGMMGRGRGF